MNWVNKISIIIGPILWTVFALAQSDNCNTATIINLTNGAACVNGTTTNSTSNNTMYGTCNTNPVNDVWYTFVASGSQNDFTIIPNGLTNAEIVIDIDGCTNNSFASCANATGTNTLNTSWGVTVGTQVWIMIASNGGTEGDFQFCIDSYDPPPGNGNACSGAIPLCDVNQVYNVPNISYLNSSGVAPSCFPGAGNQDIWYQFTVTQTGILEWEATPLGANIELDWAIFDITSGCPGVELACNYNYTLGSSFPAGMIAGVPCVTCPTSGTILTACGEYCDPIIVTAGNTYAILIDNYTSTLNTGLNFAFGPGMTAQIAPNTAFTISPSGITCGSNVTITINNTSLGVPNWDFGNGNTYTGTNPPAQTYTNPGVYAITATITGTCPSVHTEYVEIYGPLIATSSAVNENCGACDGSASVTADGGDGIFTYLWNTGASTPTITGLCAGSYSVTVSNAICSTQVVETIFVNSGGSLNFTNTNTNVLCAGANNGTATVTPTSGSSPYTYLWADGQSTSTAMGLAAGSYSVTITDAAGCDTIATIIINEPSPIVSDTSGMIITDASCSGADGAITGITAAGGTGTLTYSWEDGNSIVVGSAVNLSNIPAGNFTIYVNDANGCSAQAGPFAVAATAGTTIAVTSLDANCASQCDGTATVNVVGGTPPYTYLWDDPNSQTTQTAIALCAGTYNIIVTDNTNTCPSTTSIIISDPTILSLSLSNTDVLCYSGCDGTASASVSGGTGPYTYSWSNSSSSSSITGLCTGNYTVTVFDSKGCDTIQSFSINQPSMLLATGTTVASKCGNNDGSATINPSGGINPYTYLWDDPNAQSTQTADSLFAQTYNVTISDANGCNFILPVTIGYVDGPGIDTMTSTAVNCFGDSDGSATVSIVNGTPPLVYAWDNGSTTSTITGLIAGSYNVTITDLYSCDTVGTITITEPTELLVNIMGTDTMCYGETGGILNANASGGTPQYTYIWNNLSANSSIIVSPTNTTTYSVTITDSNNCQTQDSSSIFISPALVASVTNEVICEGDNVLISVSASFGNGGPYNYLWNDGSTTSAITVSPLTNTNYQVTVTDGCSMPTNEALTVNVSPNPEALFSVSCFPDPYVSQFTDESIIDTGNISSWFWDFDDGEISTKQNPVHEYSSATTYNVNLTITSADGCVDTYSLLVQSPPIANFSPYPPETTTANPIIEFTDASINNITMWSWDFGDGSSTTTTIPIFAAGETLPHTYDSAGIYKITLMVTDINGCLDTASEYVQIFEEYILFAPNTFTPNGNGLNEKFMPVGVGFDTDNFEMLIYDRWGDLIYKTRDYKKPWDGKANNGTREAQADVYVWMINSTDPKKKKHQYIGHVTLIK